MTGTYIAYYFSKETNKDLSKTFDLFKQLFSLYNISFEDSEYEPHITLIYDKDTNYEDNKFNKLLNQIDNKHIDCDMKFNTLVGHDNRIYLVIELSSVELTEIFKFLTSNGFTHSYNEFKPHITIGIIPEGNDMNKVKYICEEMSKNWNNISLDCHYVIEPIKE